MKSLVKPALRSFGSILFLGFIAGWAVDSTHAWARINPAGIDPEALERIAHANRQSVVRIETRQYFPSEVAEDVHEVADSPSYLGVAGRSLMFVGELPFKTLWQGVKLAIHPTELTADKSVGSGFILDETGEILTAEHVITGADSIRVEVPDVGRFPASIIGSDRDTDLALIQITGAQAIKFRPVVLGDSDKLKAGQVVMAIGSPFGLQQSVSAGVVSAVGLLGGDQRNVDMVQHDAGINPGSSGGPLFDLEGKVVGINASIASRGQDIGFAIPINTARSELDDLRRGAEHQRSYLGISFQPVSLDLMKELKLSSNSGVALTTVDSDSPAAKAGLKQGDVIVSFAGQKIARPEDLFRAINRVPPDKPEPVDFLREGKVTSIDVAPAARPHGKSVW